MDGSSIRPWIAGGATVPGGDRRDPCPQRRQLRAIHRRLPQLRRLRRCHPPDVANAAPIGVRRSNHGSAGGGALGWLTNPYLGGRRVLAVPAELSLSATRKDTRRGHIVDGAASP